MLCLPSEPLISDTAHRRAEENSQPFTKPRRRASRLQLRKTCPPRRTLPLALNRPTAPHHPAAQYKRPSSTRLLGGLLSIFLLLSILRLGPWGSWDSDPDPSPRPSRLGAPIEVAASGKILLNRFLFTWTCISPHSRAVGFRFHLFRRGLELEARRGGLGSCCGLQEAFQGRIWWKSGLAG